VEHAVEPAPRSTTLAFPLCTARHRLAPAPPRHGPASLFFDLASRCRRPSILPSSHVAYLRTDDLSHATRKPCGHRAPPSSPCRDVAARSPRSRHDPRTCTHCRAHTSIGQRPSLWLPQHLGCPHARVLAATACASTRTGQKAAPFFSLAQLPPSRCCRVHAATSRVHCTHAHPGTPPGHAKHTRERVRTRKPSPWSLPGLAALFRRGP